MTDAPLAQIKVQELLKEVRVDYTRCRIVEAAVAAVKAALLSLPDKQVSPRILNPQRSCGTFSADALLIVSLNALVLIFFSRLAFNSGLSFSSFCICKRSWSARR